MVFCGLLGGILKLYSDCLIRFIDPLNRVNHSQPYRRPWMASNPRYEWVAEASLYVLRGYSSAFMGGFGIWTLPLLSLNNFQGLR